VGETHVSTPTPRFDHRRCRSMDLNLISVSHVWVMLKLTIDEQDRWTRRAFQVRMRGFTSHPDTCRSYHFYLDFQTRLDPHLDPSIDIEPALSMNACDSSSGAALEPGLRRTQTTRVFLRVRNLHHRWMTTRRNRDALRRTRATVATSLDAANERGCRCGWRARIARARRDGRER